MSASSEDPDTPKRGKIKKTKERNLLERLRILETLRFMDDLNIPFTNNPGKTTSGKVQQKFRYFRNHSRESKSFAVFEAISSKMAYLHRGTQHTFQENYQILYYSVIVLNGYIFLRLLRASSCNSIQNKLISCIFHHSVSARRRCVIVESSHLLFERPCQ